MKRTFLAILLVAAACDAHAAEALDLRVTTDRSVDPASFETIAKSVCRPDMTEKQKALALWEFFNTHVFHWDYIGGGWDVLCTYGYGLCGTQWRTYSELYPTAMGAGTVRGGGLTCWAANPEANRVLSRGWLSDTWLMSQKSATREELTRPADPAKLAAPGPSCSGGHTMGEVKFDGAWHFMDIHAGFYVYTADGENIATVDEIRSDPSLVSDPIRIPPRFMPCDNGEPHFYHRMKGSAGGEGGGEPSTVPHPANLRAGLRQVRYYGKTFPNAYVYSAGWERMPHWYAEKGPRHLCNGEESWRHHGNGEIVFEPDATPLWAEAIVKSENLAGDIAKDTGLRGADQSKPFSFSVEFQTPHVFVAENIAGQVVGHVEIKRGAKTVWVGGDPAKIDPTPIEVKPGAKNGSLGAKVTYTIRGDAGAAIRNFRLAPIFQYNYFVSPRPKPGDNKIRVTWSNQSSMKDRAVRITWTWKEKAGAKKHEQLVTESGTEYALSVGPVEITPDADRNPTYIDALSVEIVPAK